LTVYEEAFTFETRGEFDCSDITQNVSRVVRASGVKKGMALVFAGHATGVIAITEYESMLLRDIKTLLQKLVPTRGGYNHPANAHAHLRSLLLQPGKVVPVVGGRLSLGTWQSIFWIETETRPRRRTVRVLIVGE